MLRIETTIGKLEVGDIIDGPFTDGPETVTRTLDPDSFTFETDKHNGLGGCWHTAGPEGKVFVVFSSARDVATRIADALDRFPSAVRLEVLRFFCGTCGTRNCGRHR